MRALKSLAEWVLAVSLVANLGGAQPGSNFVLEPVAVSEECSCNMAARTGWSSANGICMKGYTSTCGECSKQRHCATIRSIVGDGVRGMLGDCRALPGQSPGGYNCPFASKASLSYPTGVAIDEEDNLYISDHGNNRIRMYNSATDTIVTIAGTGELGWQGDGDLAKKAQMRGPDSIALRPGLSGHTTVRREIYFSDFGNQRVRKLVQMVSSDDWYIYTVVGTGAMGDNLDCDAGCDPLQANLNFPRALAFSSNQDLFIVDSGNLKVRKLTSDPGDPSSNSAGLLSTFVGLPGTPPTRGEDGKRGGLLVYPKLTADYLPGHWEEPIEKVSFGTVYTVTVDAMDNLWIADSQDNRILMVPLQSRNFTVTNMAKLNNLVEGYASKFAKSGDERFSLLSNTSQGIVNMAEVWLQGHNGSVQVKHVLTFNTSLPWVKNQSYWRYASPGKGYWCSKKGSLSRGSTHDNCVGVPAQNAKFSSVMSMCFDRANNMYISDSESSEVVHLNREKLFYGIPTLEVGNLRKTTTNCECDKQWTYDGYSTNESCTRDGDPTGLEWCMIKSTSCIDRTPRETWGLCNVHALNVKWHKIEGSAILGNQLLSVAGSQAGQVYVEIGDQAGKENMRLRSCEDRCVLDSNCKAFMALDYPATGSQAKEGSKPVWKCVYFGQVSPFTVWSVTNTTAGPEVMELVPISMYFNDTCASCNNSFGIDMRPNSTNGSSDAVAVHPEAALAASDCAQLCAANADCWGVALPGCYLLSENAINRTKAGMAALVDDKTMRRPAVYVKQFFNEEITSVAGFPEAKTFAREGTAAQSSYLNRPGTCAVNSRGDLIFADVWNMRIRSITNMIQDCAHSATQGSREAVTEWQEMIGVAYDKCSKSAKSDLNSLINAMQQQVVENLDTSLVESHFCRWGNTTNSSLTSTFTNNTIVLCRVCNEVKTGTGQWPNSPLCPWEEMCTCADAIINVLKTEMYGACGENAYYDSWHRWVSSYVGCLAKDSNEAAWWKDPQQRAQLKSAINGSTV